MNPPSLRAVRGVRFALAQLLRLVLAVALVALVHCGSSSDGGGSSTPGPDGGTLPDGAVVPPTDSGTTDGALPSNAALSALKISAAPLVPAFDPATITYSSGPVPVGGILLPPSTTVTATAADARAKITVNGAPVASGAASAPIPLATGTTPIDVVVTAADGTTATYHVGVGGLVNHYLKGTHTGVDSYYGTALAVSADGATIAVGVPFAGGAGISAGAVYVYARSAQTWVEQAYLKASNPGAYATFGQSVALTADGATLVVGSPGEASNAVGVNGNQADTSAPRAGAAYVFTRSGTTWTQAAYLKASNTRAAANFGFSVALSVDATTLAVGSLGETSNAVGVNGNQTDTSVPNAGAVYVFTQAASAWSQQAYIKASNTRVVSTAGSVYTGCAIAAGAYFGCSVALSADGNTLAVGAVGELSAATGVNGNQTDASTMWAGAVYVFARTGIAWAQQAYVKPTNTRTDLYFGSAIALSGDGSTLAVSAPYEGSVATGVDGNQADKTAVAAGAVYTYTRTGSAWAIDHYLKASNTKPNPTAGLGDVHFGASLALSSNGIVLAVGASGEGSPATGVNGDQSGTTDAQAGAAYVFARQAATWTQKAYVKASNTRTNARFGASVALSTDGMTFVAGAPNEDCPVQGIDGDQTKTGAGPLGAVYVF